MSNISEEDPRPSLWLSPLAVAVYIGAISGLVSEAVTGEWETAAIAAFGGAMAMRAGHIVAGGGPQNFL